MMRGNEGRRRGNERLEGMREGGGGMKDEGEE
jgi:hypothetical protein